MWFAGRKLDMHLTMDCWYYLVCLVREALSTPGASFEDVEFIKAKEFVIAYAERFHDVPFAMEYPDFVVLRKKIEETFSAESFPGWYRKLGVKNIQSGFAPGEKDFLNSVGEGVCDC